MADSSNAFLVGVDVGTGSVRAALVSKTGAVLKVAVQDTRTWNPKPEYYEQSSDDIWGAVCRTVQNVSKGIPPEAIKGIGFDATCSLVILDKDFHPVTVSPTGENDQNVILWMDHRANEESLWINSLHPDVLKYVGGKISPEMETPKLLWLKKNMHETWKKADHFMDLPDYLTWRASGALSRSLCSLVCKWTYLATESGQRGWSKEYFHMIGLEDLLEDNCSKIGNVVLEPGTPVGKGLTEKSAKELGLLPGTKVAASIIDAHAGAVGLMGCNASWIKKDFTSRLALICGTSTCHMALTMSPHFVKGIWGPYLSAVVPNLWLNEGGQTCTGHLVNHIIESHPAFSSVQQKLPKDLHIQEYLNRLLESKAKQQGVTNVAYLTNHMHMWPDFHGNRSPLADPSLLGMVSGLSLSSDEESLAFLYLTTIQALAYGTRHIMHSFKEEGLTGIESVLLCGGLSRNRLFVQVHADVLGLPVLCAREPESVLLGSAILGAFASGIYSTVGDAMVAMGGHADVVNPDQELQKSKYHDKKFKVFLKMVEHQLLYKNIMSSEI